MIVYSIKTDCYRCGKPMLAYTYVWYRDGNGDVCFPYEDWMMIEAYNDTKLAGESNYFDKNSSALNFPVFTLGYNSELDLEVFNSGKFPNIKLINSQQRHGAYYANTCEECGSFLGAYYLLEHVTDNHLKPNEPMPIACKL